MSKSATQPQAQEAQEIQQSHPVNNNNKQFPQKNRRLVQLRFVVMPFIIIFGTVILVVLAAFLAPKPAKKPVLAKAPLVAIVSLTAKDLHFNVLSQGSVKPRTETDIISEVSGRVTHVSPKFFVGGFFKKGELLLTIDDALYKINLIKAQASLVSAKANLLEESAKVNQAKQEWLLSGKILSKAPVLAIRTPQLQRAKAAVTTAMANVDEAKIKLAETKIVAPYDAVLKTKQADIGQYITVGSHIAATFAVDYAEIRLPVQQRDLNFLHLPAFNLASKPLTSVELYSISATSPTKWQAYLSHSEEVISDTSRVHYLVAKIDDPYNILKGNGAHELRIGRFVKAKIKGKLFTQVFAIPRNIVHGENSLYILSKKDQLKIIKVNVLRSDAHFIYSKDQQLSGKKIIKTNIEMPVVGMALRLAVEPTNISLDPLNHKTINAQVEKSIKVGEE